MDIVYKEVKMKNLKKILAFALVLVMILGMSSMAFADGESKGDDTLPDIVLNGGEEGGSKMIGKYTAPSKKGVYLDDYKYLGYASFLDKVPDKTYDQGNYKYLVMTYTGDITQLRFQFNRLSEDGDQELTEAYWFNPEGQTLFFKTADGSEIPLIGDNTTIVIDLQKSGVELDWYNSGVHMHCDEMLTHGDGKGFTISNAYLTTSLPQEESSTESGETSQETTAPETSAPATSAPETTAPAIVSTEAGNTMEAIILDGGEEGKSKFIKKFVNNKAATDTDPAYKYLGYVTFKDLANANYRYLAVKYTGDISNLRLQFVHDAGGANEEMDDVYWFNAEGHDKKADPSVDPCFVTADGSAIPLVGNNTLIFIDLQKSGVDVGYYNSGFHVHVNGLADIDISYAALLTELPKDDAELPTGDTVINPPATTKAAGGKTPSTGDVSPIVVVSIVCVLSVAVLGGAVVARKKYL